MPDNTLYTIDKVVRDRLRQGRFGIDFSEFIGIERDEETKVHFYHHEMLRTGKISIEVPYVPVSEQLKDRLAKSPMLPQNVPTYNPSKYSTIRKPKSTKRAKTVAKYGSCRKGKGTAKEEYTDWRMRKRAEDRMREKLVTQAKDEIRKEIFLDMVEAYHNVPLEVRMQSAKNPNIQEVKKPTEESQNQVESKVPTFGNEKTSETEPIHYTNFSEFAWKTRHAIYPNPVF